MQKRHGMFISEGVGGGGEGEQKVQRSDYLFNIIIDFGLLQFISNQFRPATREYRAIWEFEMLILGKCFTNEHMLLGFCV